MIIANSKETSWTQVQKLIIGYNTQRFYCIHRLQFLIGTLFYSDKRISLTIVDPICSSNRIMQSTLVKRKKHKIEHFISKRTTVTKELCQHNHMEIWIWSWSSQGLNFMPLYNALFKSMWTCNRLIMASCILAVLNYGQPMPYYATITVKPLGSIPHLKPDWKSWNCSWSCLTRFLSATVHFPSSAIISIHFDGDEVNLNTLYTFFLFLYVFMHKKALIVEL